MKLGKIILSVSAIAVTAASAFALTSKSTNGTLFTKTAGVFHKVACSLTNQGAGTCPNVTYYTAINKKNLGKITPFIVSE